MIKQRLSYNQWFRETRASFDKGGHNLRKGQFFMNALCDVSPKLHQKIVVEGRNDPFYDDSKFSLFVGYVMGHWHQK